MNLRSGFPVDVHPIRVKSYQIDPTVVNIRVSPRPLQKSKLSSSKSFCNSPSNFTGISIFEITYIYEKYTVHLGQCSLCCTIFTYDWKLELCDFLPGRLSLLTAMEGLSQPDSNVKLPGKLDQSLCSCKRFWNSCIYFAMTQITAITSWLKKSSTVL